MRCMWDITPISTPTTSPRAPIRVSTSSQHTSTNPAYSTAHAQFLLPQQRVNIGMAERVAAALVERAISGGLQQLAMERSSQPVVWPTSEEFTVEKGEKAIERTVKRWQVSDSWKYCIDYLGARTEGGVSGARTEGGKSAELHWYRVQWSQPTRRNPVPVATASVYFFLQEHGKESPVLPFYVLEGQRLVHRPGNTEFQEVWLHNLIQHKLSILHTGPQWSPIRTT